MMQCCSIGNIRYLCSYRDASVWIKRDDLIPFSYGGTKVRIAAEAFLDIRDRACTSVISYGSPGSNLNRAVADMAKKNGIPCHVIIKRGADYSANGSCAGSTPGMPLNERLVMAAGADITYCGPSNVRETVEEVMRRAVKNGERPYYIYGNSLGEGNTCTLMRASYREHAEITDFERAHNTYFGHIFLAVGTGMTISGFIAAEAEERTRRLRSSSDAGEKGFSHFFHGISVARRAAAEKNIILKNLREGCPGTLLSPYVRSGFSDIYSLTDEYLGGGYGSYTPGMLSLIRDIYKTHGIALDPTYTGKAFYGMLCELDKPGLYGNILFIHTGGYPGFLDMKEDIC